MSNAIWIRVGMEMDLRAIELPARIRPISSEGVNNTLLGLEFSQIQDWVMKEGWERFRAAQIFHTLYGRGVGDWTEATDLPRALRERLTELGPVYPLTEIARQESRDGTVKFLFTGAGGVRVETVAIPEGERWTVCLSSQSGCALGCKFCATGYMGFYRNLTAGEILAQLMLVERGLGRRMSNIVFMGMGEPLLNRKALFTALRILTDRKGKGLSRRRITISTVGWLPGIKAMIAALSGASPNLKVQRSVRSQSDVDQRHPENLPAVKLAISLNAVSDDQRKELFPIASRYPISEILEAAHRYQMLSGLKVSLNYLLLKGVNDTPAHIVRLAEMAARFRFKVNLMEYNDTGAGFERCEEATVIRLGGILQRSGVTFTVRTSRGRDIDAACGQLAGREPLDKG